MKRTVLLALALVMAVFAACQASGPTTEPFPGAPTGQPQPGVGQPAPYPQTIKDSSGADVTIPAQPKRIISLSPGMTETLFAIGAGPQVVATDQFSDYPEAAKRTEKLDYSRPDPEKLVALQPDLVFLATRQQGFVDHLRSLNLRVLFLAEPDSLEGVLEQIRLAGRVTGHGSEAEQLALDMQQRIDRVKERVESLSQGPRVFIELDATGYTVAPHSFIGSMLTALKARNIAEGAQAPFPQLSREAIVERNPEVIILLDANYGETPEKVRARPGWGNIAAVRSGRIYPLEGDIVSRPGPRVVEGLEQMARLLYPDRF